MIPKHMPPKASNKIATAIAAVNRTVVRNVKAANRAVVKNYNAANRAINRAPAWVKWTIAAIAIAIIGYALWKVFFAPRREGFAAAPEGYTKYENTDMRFCSDVPGFVPSRKNLADAAEGCNKSGDRCDGFTFDTRGSSDGTGMVYEKSFVIGCTNGENSRCNTDPGLVMYIKKTKNEIFTSLQNCSGDAGTVTGGNVVNTEAAGATATTGECTTKIVLPGVVLRNYGPQKLSDYYGDIPGGYSEDQKSGAECCRFAKTKAGAGANGYVFIDNTSAGMKAQCYAKHYSSKNMTDIADKVNGETGIFGDVPDVTQEQLNSLKNMVSPTKPLFDNAAVISAYKNWQSQTFPANVGKCSSVIKIDSTGFSIPDSTTFAHTQKVYELECCRWASTQTGYNGFVFEKDSNTGWQKEIPGTCWAVKFSKTSLAGATLKHTSAGLFDEISDITDGKTKFEQLATDLNKYWNDSAKRQEVFDTWKLSNVSNISTGINYLTLPDNSEKGSVKIESFGGRGRFISDDGRWGLRALTESSEQDKTFNVTSEASIESGGNIIQSVFGKKYHNKSKNSVYIRLSKDYWALWKYSPNTVFIEGTHCKQLGHGENHRHCGGNTSNRDGFEDQDNEFVFVEGPNDGSIKLYTIRPGQDQSMCVRWNGNSDGSLDTTTCNLTDRNQLWIITGMS